MLCPPALRGFTDGLIIALTSSLLFFERYFSVSSASCPSEIRSINSLQLPWFCLGDTNCLYTPALQSHSQLLGWGHSTSGVGDFL